MEYTEKHESPKLTLRVKVSRVSTTGTLRINVHTLEKLEMREGEKLVVSGVNRKKTLITYADELINEDTISIRKEDMESLAVEEGENVIVYPHGDLTERLMETVEGSTEKFKHKLNELKHGEEEEGRNPGKARDGPGNDSQDLLSKLKGFFRKRESGKRER